MDGDDKFKDTQAVRVYDLLAPKGMPMQSFVVPRFQRNYAWTDSKIESFWSDIYGNFTLYRDEKSKGNPFPSQYMLGPIVLLKHNFEETFEWRVIDGQQRLATISTLFCVARDIMCELLDPDKLNLHKGYGMAKELINKHDLMGNSGDPKLELNLTDKELFRSQIQEEGKPGDKIKRWNKNWSTYTKSNRRLLNSHVKPVPHGHGLRLYRCMLNQAAALWRPYS